MTASRTAALALITAIASAACGLKGPLELPERSTNIVIRGPGQPSTTTPEGGTGTTSAAPPGTPPPATEPSKAPAAKPIPPTDERLPPPELPGGNSGSSRGG